MKDLKRRLKKEADELPSSYALLYVDQRHSISLTSKASPALRKCHGRLYESWHHLLNLLPPDLTYIVTLKSAKNVEESGGRETFADLDYLVGDSCLRTCCVLKQRFSPPPP